MEQDFITGLYESINGKRIGSEDDFRKALKDSTFAKGIYESINGKRIGTFDQFMQAVGGSNQSTQTYGNVDLSSTQQEPNFYYQPKSQTPLELLANRPTPLIDKKGKSYYKLDDILSKAEQKVQDEHDNLFEYLGKKITGTASNLLKFGIGPGAGAMSWGLAEAKRSAEEKVRVGAAEKERKSLINSINPNDVEAASYEDLYKDIYDEVGDETTAVRKANIAIKQHANRVNEITQSYYDRLKGKEKKAADDLMNGLQTEPLEAPSEDFNNWIDLVDKNSAQSKELNLHTDQYKEALTGILNVIGEAKNENLSPTETEAAVKGYVNSLPYNSPLRTKVSELYEGAVKDAEWSSAGLAQSILNNTLLKGAKTIEAGLETSKWLGNGLSKMFEGFNETNPLNDKGLSELEKKEAFKSSTRAITQALIDPSSKYTGAISEQVVDKNGRRLVVKDGKVIDIRRPDGTKVFKPTQADIKIAESYDPKKDVARGDYRGKSIAYQAGQVISDMAPMIIIGAVSGGTGAAAGATTRGQVLGSALISAGDYYQEGLDATGSVGQAALYAGFTAPMIGYVESKIGNIEAKLGRSIIGAERQGIFEAIKKEGKLIAQQGIESYVKGPGAMARAVKALKKAGEIGNDIKDELIEEFTNFPVEFVGQYISGMDPGPAPKEELEATAILTPLVTLALGGAKLMFDNQRDIDELVGYAALNKDHFEALGQQWIDSSKTDKEKSERTKDFEAKKAAVNEVHDTFNYIDENDFTPKQKDSLLELSFEKARAIYRQNISNSAKTKADLALKIEAIDNKMSTIMNSETKAADTYLNDEEVVAEPSLITTPKIETQLEKGVDEPKVVEPAPVLGAEFDNFLATEGINLETEVSLGDVESRMTNAEYIDIKELNTKSDKLYQVWDKVDQDSRLTPETKEALKSKLENLITKLETYELATTDEVSTTTEGGAAKGVRIIGTKKIEKPSRFEVTPERIAKQKATRVTDKNGNEFGGVFEYKGGKLSVQTKNGTIPVDQNTLQFKQSIKENDTVVGAEVYDPSTGHTFTIGNRELALDMALKAKEMEFGVAEEPLFEEVFSEVTSKTTTTKRLVREQPNTTPTTTITVEAPKIEVTTDTSQQSNKVEPDNTTTKADIERRRQELEKKYEETKERHLKELEKAGVDLGKWGMAFNDIIHNIEEENNSNNYSEEVETLARKQYEEWWALNREKQEIESDANKLSFSDYNFSGKKSILDKLKKALSAVYQSNRQALDEGFVEWYNVEREVASAGGNQYAAHGMGKTSIASAFTDLINLFEKGINPFRGQGALDVATLAGGVSDGTTAGGAYMDGAFTLVANRNHNGRIENINQIGGIIVNEGIATPEVLSALKELFPNLVIESTLNSKSLVEQLNAKYDAELATLEETSGVSGSALKDVDITKPKVGKYDGDTDFEVRTPEQLNIDDVLKRDKPIKLYPEQIVPIDSQYSEKESNWVADRDIVINEGYGSIEIKKGDKLFIRVDNPANGDATSSTSYKVYIKGRSYPLSHFIPETAEHGSLDEPNHFDAVTQMKNFDKVLSGEIETPQQSKEQRIKIAETLIPNKDFYVAKPYNSKSGFESPQKVIFKDGKWLRLRDDEWDNTKDYEYNVWGEYADKNELAWDIVSNARVILKNKNADNLQEQWDKQFDYLTAENKKRVSNEAPTQYTEASGVSGSALKDVESKIQEASLIKDDVERKKELDKIYNSDEYKNWIKDAEEELKNNKTQVAEGKGSWRKAFNETSDAMRKKDILRAVADVSTDINELNEISKASKGLPEGLQSEIDYAVEHKKKSLAPTSAELEDDLKNNRFFSKSYNSESEVPEEFKDKIVRKGTTEVIDSKGNKKTVNEVVVSMPLSEYNYRQALKNKNETSKSGGNTTSTTSNSTEDVLAKQEDELETILEPLGKTQKEREGQIEKFFTSKDSGVDPATAKEQAKLTSRVWQAVAKYFGKRNKQSADEYIASKLKFIGQTLTSKLDDTAKMQGGLEITPQMAEQLSANLLTHLDTMIEERTNPSKVAKALKENRGLTKSAIADQVQRLKEVRDLLIRNGRVSYQMDDIWHGSPHDVDKFSTSKIGTGEGVQAFGWGLYFTNLKAIAKHYAESLTPGRKYSFDGVKDLDNVATHPMTKIFLREMLKSNPANREDAIKWVEKNSNGKSEKVVSELAKFASILLVDNSVNRNLYKVTLHKDKSPGQYTWLEWDKSVSDKTLESLGVRNQKLNERDYYISLLSSKDLSLLGDINQYSTKEIKETTYSKNDFKSYKEYVKEFEQDKSNRFYTGEGLYQKLSKELGSDKAASLFLLENGIDGIKYPAESIARGTTSDNAKGFNYVVFDENAVTIEERIKFQNPNAGVNRGALIEYAKNEMIMVALESPNVSTAIHELYHVFQGDLSPDELQTVIDNYNEAFGTNHTLSDLNGKVATDIEEWGARLWEKYFENGRKLTEKEVPNAKARNAFQNIFDKFTEWMKGVYNGVISYTNADGATRSVTMTKSVQDMFDKIIGITPINEGGGKKGTSTNKAESDLSFLRDMEDFDFENLKTACVKL